MATGVATVPSSSTLRHRIVARSRRLGRRGCSERWFMTWPGYRRSRIAFEDSARSDEARAQTRYAASKWSHQARHA